MGVRRRYWRVLALFAAMALFCVFSGPFFARATEDAGEWEDSEDWESWEDGYGDWDEYEDWDAYGALEAYGEEETCWMPLEPGELSSGDVIAITMEWDGGLVALDNGCGPVEVCLEGRSMVCFGPEIGWLVSMEEGCLLLEPLAGEGWLNYSDMESRLSVTGYGDPYWLLLGEGLQHYMTESWLCLEDQEGGLIWTVGEAAPLTLWVPGQPGGPDTPGQPEEPVDLPDFPWTPWFGQLHAHTNLSDGLGEVEEAFRYAREEAGLDFFAVTDHSTSFDHALEGQLAADARAVSEKWARGKAAAEEATAGDFLGIFGYEMTWPDTERLGHIVTLFTPGFQTPEQPGFQSLEGYYRALAAVPESVGMFAHPKISQGFFENFRHREAAYDAQMDLIEVGSEGGFRAWEYYTIALDAGWHVAPAMNQANHRGGWGTEDHGRTVVLAENLTEECLREAIKARRVYATEDADLEVYVTLNGQIMGSRIPAEETAVVQAWVLDPTDPIGRVEVVTAGGRVADWAEVSGNQGELEFILPGDQPYYFLRITQPDGDVAVTAPIWLERYEDMGIGELAVEGGEVRGRRAEIALTLFNNEPEPLELTSVELFAGGEALMAVEEPGILAPLERRSFTAFYVAPEAGMVEYGAEVTGVVMGRERQWSETASAWYREPEMTSGLLAWGFSPGELNNLEALAEDFDLALELVEGELPEGGSVLLLGPPREPLDPVFLAQIQAFAENGGSLILCGQAEDPAAAQVLNDLLRSLGSTLAFYGDRVLDQERCGGRPDHIFPAVFSGEALQAGNLLEGQYYRHLAGCSVDSGAGSWLVKGWPSTQSSREAGVPVLLAWEDTAWGGRIAAAGSPFFTDEAMPLPQTGHSLPTANQSLLEALLGMERDRYPLSAIEELRRGTAGGIYRVRGHVTAGTSSPHNTFSRGIYLQDDTGGIAVSGMPKASLEIGQYLEVLGMLSRSGGDPVLKRIRDHRPQGDAYRYVPLALSCQKAMDFEHHGGELLQAEGVVEGVVPTEDGRGVARFSLRDSSGVLANFRVEAGIGAWATGRNDLASVVLPGSTVRAVGILRMGSEGLVLEVRDCEEVLSIAPPPEPPQEETQPEHTQTEPSQAATEPSQEETAPSQETEPSQAATEPEQKPAWPWQSREDKANPKTGDGLGRWLAWAMG